MLSPIQSYFGSDPNSIASAFSLPRHDHYPRPSDDPQSTAGPADGYHATFDSGQDVLQYDQDLEDGDSAMGESYDCQESILQSEDDTGLLEDEDDEDDESYPYGCSGTEFDDELFELCGLEEDGDSDIDDQGRESLLAEEEDTSVSYTPRIADLDSTKPRYDQSTYLGRVKHFIKVTSPRNLFVSGKGLENAKNLINDYNAGKMPASTDPAKLWRAKEICDSTLHPDTGKPIFLPFRMSCFVPTNMLVAAGMLMPNPTVKSIIFWQWANQSINVAFNSANSNKTTEMNMKETAVAYVSAVTTSCFLAVGLNQLVPRMTSISPGLRTILGRLVPFTAVAAAGTVNVFLMRGKEISEGIDVYDHEGKSVGKSQKAGMSAITQVAISRVLTNFPVLTIPPLVLSQWERTIWAQQYPKAVIPINLAVISLVLMSALPLAIAAFPQYANVDVHTLEERFWNLKDSKGEPIKTLTYNKGL
ncbi:hypothetical protein BGZ93_001382 [Podila epicladia]|nr:hypothetical protein BGZ93_001382 [Podila epicladia]